MPQQFSGTDLNILLLRQIDNRYTLYTQTQKLTKFSDLDKHALMVADASLG